MYIVLWYPLTMYMNPTTVNVFSDGNWLVSLAYLKLDSEHK